MRKDLKHKVVEPGRRGPREDYPRHKKDFSEDAPKFEKIYQGNDWKRERGFGMTAVTRSLEKQVGRPWNDVWSEICSQADSRSFRGWHLRKVVKWNIIFDAISEDGKVYHSSWGYGNRLELYPGTLYVCPETGILKSYDRPKEKIKYSPWRVEKKLIDETSGYYKLRGIWYYLEIEEIDKEDYRQNVLLWKTAPQEKIDEWAGTYWGGRKYLSRCVFGKPNIFIKVKRQLNKRELRNLSLQNDEQTD